MRATERALPWPFTAPICAARHPGATLSAELRPVAGDRGVQLDLAALGQQQHDQRRDLLVMDQTLVTVSRSQPRVRPRSRWPPHRSTTVSPSMSTAREAPTSAARQPSSRPPPALRGRHDVSSYPRLALRCVVAGENQSDCVISATSRGPVRCLLSVAVNSVNLVVNGESRTASPEGSMPLLDLLREEYGLTGTKFGCESRSCGACTVLIDDGAALACALQPAAVAGRSVTTIEGLADGAEELHAVQQAFIDEQVGQCGWCTPAQVLTAVALLREVADPGADLIRERLSSVLCRCGTYERAVTAVSRAAALSSARGETA